MTPLNLPENAIELVKSYLIQLQKNICLTLESIDAQGQFLADDWQRPLGGGGLSCVLEQGRVFEKAGVNFSHVSGNTLPPAALLNRPELQDATFDALGVSVVIHPLNPYVPTTHANVRFFIAKNKKNETYWWFGGGFDLTPYYGFHEDCVHWHQMAEHACRPYSDELYARLKAWCDEYFYLKHRQEARGIGGLFFDDYHEHNFEHSFGLMKSVGDHFIQAYSPIVLKRKDMLFGEREKSFQRYRRGRYVEFNLVYDRGTLFGLQSGGRTESILISMPPDVVWKYNWEPEQNTPENALYTEFLPIRDWLK